MMLRSVGGSLLAALLLAVPAAGHQEAPEIPQDLQETYGAFATALVEGRADDAKAEAWMDAGHPGWSGPSARGRETPARCPHEEVDRVVFNVYGAPK